MKKKSLLIVLCVLCICVICGVSILKSKAGSSTANPSNEASSYKESTVEKGNITAGVTESGSTAIGSATMDYVVDTSSQSSGTQTASSAQSNSLSGNSVSSSSSSTPSSSSSSSTSSSMEIEEVYVTTSQVVKEGDPLLKLTDNSYQKAKEALEANVNSAKLAVTQAQIDYDRSKATAEDNYSINTSKSTTAHETYDNTVAKLANSVKQAKNSVSKKKKEIKTLKNNLAKDTYATEYKLTTLKAAMETAAKASTSDNTYKEAATAYEQAKEKYDQAVSTANTDLSKAQEELPNLQLQYKQAVTEQKTGLLEAKATLNQELVAANNADNLFSIETDGLSLSIEEAKEKLSNARKALAAFNDIINAGIIRANFDGTITSFEWEAGDTLSSGNTIVTYGDADNVTLTVSVDQEDVASIAVNDIVNLTFTAYPRESFEGSVTTISTTPTNTNSSTVSYPVTVKVNGDISQLYEGMTANATFVSKELKDVLIVSNKAIHTDGTRSYVRLKKADGTVQDTDVTTGFSDGSRVEIQDGLSEGDVVLIESQVTPK